MSKIVMGQPGQAGAGPALAAAGMHQLAQLDTTIVHPMIGGSIDDIRGEVDDCFGHMSGWHNDEPDAVMRLASGYSARFSYVRVQIMRIEDIAREWKSTRTRELEPLLEELQNQWRNASRLQSVRELDFKIETGRGTT